MALRGQMVSSALVLKTLQLLTSIHVESGDIKLLWVPSHVGIQGKSESESLEFRKIPISDLEFGRTKAGFVGKFRTMQLSPIVL